jgi:hypothetical protein
MYNSGNSSKNVTGASVVDGTLYTVDIADDAVTADKLANTVNADIATGVSGSTTAGDALPKAGGTMTGDVSLADNVKAKFGTGDDLQIYHDGSNSYIDDAGEGVLAIRSSSVRLQKYTGEEMIQANADGAVSLFYDNAAKLATTSTGATVTGDMTATSFIGDGSALTGLGKILQIVEGKTTTAVDNSTNVYSNTGLTATITPTLATSKILVVYHQNGGFVSSGSNTSGVHMRLIRDATVIETNANNVGWNALFQEIYLASMSSSYLDSPATTAATTYKTQFRNNPNSALVRVQSNSHTSTITLMEIGV